MKKMTKMIPALLLGVALLSTTAVMAMDVVDGSTASAGRSASGFKLESPLLDELFSQIGTQVRQNIAAARAQIEELNALGADVAAAEAVAALNKAFPGVVSPQRRIIGDVPSAKAEEFFGLKKVADRAQSRADAVSVRLSHLASRIAQEQKTGAFFENAPRTLAVLKALQDAVVSKETLYPEAFAPTQPQAGMMHMAYAYPPKLYNAFGGDRMTKENLRDENLSHFTIGALKGKSQSDLYVDFGFSRFHSISDAVRAQLASIVGDDVRQAQNEINAWLSAFPEYFNRAGFAVAGAESLARATDAKLSSLLTNVSASISDLDAATSDARVFAKTQAEEGKKVSALGTVKKWLDEVADHLRVRGFVS